MMTSSSAHNRLALRQIAPKWIAAFIFLLINALTSYSQPRELYDGSSVPASAPIWGRSDHFIAFTNRELDELYVIELDKLQSPYRVAKAKGIGRRFAFDPNDDRIVFRQRAEAHPAKPDRLVSCSVFLHDPQMVTDNNGPLFGPYLIMGTIWYRETLSGPFHSLDGRALLQGPWHDAGERLSVRDASGKEVYESSIEDSIAGFELSPDGKWVAAVSGGARPMLTLVSTEDGTRIPLYDGRWPSWSGDSRRVAFLRDKPAIHFAEIVVYDMKHAELRSVTGLNKFWPNEPALNHDGTRCVFVQEGSLYEVPTGLTP